MVGLKQLKASVYSHGKQGLFQEGTNLINKAHRRVCIVAKTPIFFVGPRPHDDPLRPIHYEADQFHAYFRLIDLAGNDRRLDFRCVASVQAIRQDIEALDPAIDLQRRFTDQLKDNIERVYAQSAKNPDFVRIGWINDINPMTYLVVDDHFMVWFKDSFNQNFWIMARDETVAQSLFSLPDLSAKTLELAQVLSRIGVGPSALDPDTPIEDSIDSAVTDTQVLHGRDETNGEIISWLVDQNEIDLKYYSVVGNYVCADITWRGILAKKIDDLKVKAQATTDFKPIPVLLCAAPGSGKTFFVREFQKGIEGTDRLIMADLSDAEDLTGQLQAHYRDIVSASTEVRVAFLDEVDTPVGGEHAYRFLLKPLLGEKVEIGDSEKKIRNVIWFFAASGREFAGEGLSKEVAEIDLGELQTRLAKFPKGMDFARRFEQAGIALQLPSIDSWKERILRAVAVAKGHKDRIEMIDAAVLYYVAIERWPNSGALKGCIDKSVGRCAGTILRLENVLEGAALREYILSRAKELVRLDGHVIKIATS